MTLRAFDGATKGSVVPRLTWAALRQRYVHGAREIRRGVVSSREHDAGVLRLQAPREARVHGSESGDEEATVRRSFGERRLETMPRLLKELRATDDFLPGRRRPYRKAVPLKGPIVQLTRTGFGVRAFSVSSDDAVTMSFRR